MEDSIHSITLQGVALSLYPESGCKHAYMFNVMCILESRYAGAIRNPDQI